MVSQLFSKTSFILSPNLLQNGIKNGNGTTSTHGHSVSVCTDRQLSYDVGPSTVPFDKEKQNKVFLIGRLGKDFEVHVFSDDRKTARSSLAVTKFVKGSEDTDWYSLVVWEELAEKLPNQLRKGARVMVEGRLNLEKYEGRDGGMRMDVKVTASSVHLVRDGAVDEFEEPRTFSNSYVNPYPSPSPSPSPSLNQPIR